MSNTQLSVKGFFSDEKVRAKFEEIMGERAPAFITSALSAVNQNAALRKCEPQSIYTAAMMAAVLNLPVSPSLGNAYIVPYGSQAQFQIGYKGLIQLAMRSGQFKNIDAKAVYEGQVIVDDDTFTGYKFKWSARTGDKVVGYAAYFSLVNGFEKMLYMTMEEIEAHKSRFSKTANSGPWKTDFDSMAIKTVLKKLLGKYAPMSIEMERAHVADQSVIKDVDTMDVDYVDHNEGEVVDEAPAALAKAAEKAKSNPAPKPKHEDEAPAEKEVKAEPVKEKSKPKVEVKDEFDEQEEHALGEAPEPSPADDEDDLL